MAGDQACVKSLRTTKDSPAGKPHNSIDPQSVADCLYMFGLLQISRFGTYFRVSSMNIKARLLTASVHEVNMTVWGNYTELFYQHYSDGAFVDSTTQPMEFKDIVEFFWKWSLVT